MKIQFLLAWFFLLNLFFIPSSLAAGSPPWINISRPSLNSHTTDQTPFGILQIYSDAGMAQITYQIDGIAPANCIGGLSSFLGTWSGGSFIFNYWWNLPYLNYGYHTLYMCAQNPYGVSSLDSVGFWVDHSLKRYEVIIPY